MTTSPISGVSSYAQHKAPIKPIDGFKSDGSTKPNLENIFQAASNVLQPKKIPGKNQVQPAFSANAKDVFNGFNENAPKGTNFTALA